VPQPRTVGLGQFHARMVRSARTLDEFYAAMEAWTHAIVAANPILVCQEGCARCCKHQVLVGEPEWAHILRWMHANLTPEHRRRIVRRTQAQLVQPGNPLSRWLGMRGRSTRVFMRTVARGAAVEATRCPMLDDDNRCAIYPARPFVCRAYGRSALADGSLMLCDIFAGRIRQSPGVEHTLDLAPMPVTSQVYLSLNRAPATNEPGQFTIMSAHVLRHATRDDDLATDPVPLAAETRFPVVAEDAFDGGH